ncbi:MAG: ribose 5-phosphate isomerase B [Myxococcota bacterium]
MADASRRFIAGADHAGVDLKDALVAHLRELGHEVEDLGTHGHESVDYPDFAHAVVTKVLEERAAGGETFGLLCCGTGLGVMYSANRHRGIRAALCSEPWSAEMSRRHNDANVLCMGGRVVGAGLAKGILEAFLAAPFEGGRHARRVGKIEL